MMTESALIYRRATSTDIVDIVSLLLVAYQDHQAEIGDEQWNRMKLSLSNHDLITKLVELTTGFTCQFHNQLVGIVFLIPSGNPTQIFPADWCYLRFLGVDPNYRGLGIGRKLTQLCIEQARQMDEQTIGLHTSEFMSTARRLYEGFGFKQIKEIEPIYNKRFWLYKLNLKGN